MHALNTCSDVALCHTVEWVGHNKVGNKSVSAFASASKFKACPLMSWKYDFSLI